MKTSVVFRASDGTQTNRVMSVTEVMKHLAGVIRNRGVSLLVITGDNDRIEIFPKCERCGCYNTLHPLADELCRECRI